MTDARVMEPQLFPALGSQHSRSYLGTNFLFSEGPEMAGIGIRVSVQQYKQVAVRMVHSGHFYYGFEAERPEKSACRLLHQASASKWGHSSSKWAFLCPCAFLLWDHYC